MKVAEDGVLPRFGLIMTDELRTEGLKEILGDGVRCRILPLAAHRVREAGPLDLIVLDAAAAPLLIEAVTSLRRARPDARLLILGPRAGPEQIEAMIASGAKGFVPYEAKADELRMAVDVVLDGSVWAPRKVLARLIDKADRERTSARQAEPRFTERELAVLRLLVLGQSNREIALGMGVDEGTVRAHMARLMRKAAVDNRTALSMRALQGRWVVD